MRYRLLPYLLLLVLYGTVGFTSFGFDDEFFNIRLIETLGWRTIEHVQTVDVHPPGSYALNWFFYSLAGDWSIVRLIAGLITGGSIIYFVESIFRRDGGRAAVMAFLLLGLNPGLLMWCTSVRWYAFFVPILIWLSVLPRKTTQWWWWRFCLGFLALAYIGYAAFLLLPAFLWLYWISDDRPTALKLKSLSAPVLLSSLLYVPQFWVFVQVHAENSNGQLAFLPSTLIGFVAGHLSNPGVFPLSLIGVLSSVGTAVTIMTMIQSRRPPEVQSYLLGSLVLLLSGITYKYRNLVVLGPLQTLALSRTVALDPSRWIYLGVTLIVAGNVVGVANVTRHEGTAKLGWNLPYSQVMDELDRERGRCNSDLLVLTYDPVFVWHLDNRGYRLATPIKGSHQTVESHRGCLALIKTFSGSRGNSVVSSMIADLGLDRLNDPRVMRFSRDPYFQHKRRLDRAYPEYAVELHFRVSQTRFAVPNSWAPRQSRAPNYQ
jgi:hypothetical protein